MFAFAAGDDRQLGTAPETEPCLSQDSTFFQTLQRRPCDVFVDSPTARRLLCRHGEIRHFLEISFDSPTGVVRNATSRISGLARSQRSHGCLGLLVVGLNRRMFSSFEPGRTRECPNTRVISRLRDDSAP